MSWSFKHWLDVKSIAWLIDASIAYWLRKQGRYDKETLASFYAAWQKWPNLTTQQAYLRFRRDLGLTLPRRFIKPLLLSLTSSSKREQRFIINWLYETGRNNAINKIHTELITHNAEYSPAAATILAQRNKELTAKQKALMFLQSQQDDWRREFETDLQSNRYKICVVGNAATLLSSGYGTQIDQYSVVFRFNRYFNTSHTIESDNHWRKLQQDIGHRTTVWVCAPNLKAPYPQSMDSIEWVVVSGPDVRYQLADWKQYIPMLEAGKRVLTVPLVIWRKLAEELKAPPSAGILCLAWLVEILGSPDGLTAAGYQRHKSKSSRYHFALPRHKASQRHNWVGERAILNRWQTQGLIFME